ncbi:MAG: MBOAT family O-acyltransferase [Aggregatilineales bacterium]
MDLIHILVLALASLPFMWLIPATLRPTGLFVGSLFVIAWILGDGGLTQLDVLLLFSTIGLTVLVWWLIQPVSNTPTEPTYRTFALIGGVVALVWGGYALSSDAASFQIFLVLIVLSVTGGASLSHFFHERTDSSLFHQIALFVIYLIVVILVVIKLPDLARLSGYALTWDADSLATSSPFVWIGFSYIAFRLIGLLFDFRAGRIPKTGLSLQDTITYVLFFPAFTAGPIDRAQRFVPELQAAKPLDSARLVEGGTRIAVGVFKKFVVANSLALIAMNPRLIDLTENTTGLWILLYLYAFQIFFDFSGYSDVAIGLGRLYGITLPENFDRPYTQANIQQFWQRWHITLSTWFRVYYFTPLSRFFITRKNKPPQYVIILISQVTTMILIGLWHGITWNFLLWGLWHGAGLFAHKMLADNTKGWTKRVNANVWSSRVMYVGSVLATFHFVALGWVFFALPTVSDSLTMFSRLFGG